MRRYTIRAYSDSDRRWLDYGSEPIVSMAVIEREPSSVDTGLLDAHGHRLFASEEMEPIGFLPRKEREKGCK